MKNTKLKESFYCCIFKRTQLEITRPNIIDINTIYTIINLTEQALEEHISDTSNYKTMRNETIKTTERATKRESKKFRSYHKTYSNDERAFWELKKQ